MLYKGTLYIDWSSLSNFLKCPRYYYYHNVLRKVAISKPVLSLEWGTAFHKGVELKDLGHPTWCEDACQDYLDACGGALLYEETYTVERLRTYLETHNAYYGIADEYTGQLILTPLRSELPFQVRLTDDLVWCGKIDGVYQDVRDGLLWPSDTKTSKMPQGIKMELSMQFTGYLSAMPELYPGQVIGGLIADTVKVTKNGLQKKKDGSGWYKGCGPEDVFNRLITTRTKEQLEDWKRSVVYYTNLLKGCMVTGEFPYNSGGCYAYFRDCQYYQICSCGNKSLGERLLEDPGLFCKYEWWPSDQLKEMYEESLEGKGGQSSSIP